MRPGLIAGFVLALTGQAMSEELGMINVTNASYCSLYAREMVFIDALHSGELTSDSDVIRNAAIAHYTDCISIIPTLLPLPPGVGTFDQWVADIRDVIYWRAKIHVRTIGTAPATSAKPKDPDDEEWRRQCRAEYNTWNEDDGTVIRRGNPERVRCPCGEEVICGY